jgi:hypothetical protein
VSKSINNFYHTTCLETKENNSGRRGARREDIIISTTIGGQVTVSEWDAVAIC